MSIDILLVTYNQEQYIQQALDGILMQRVNPDVKIRIIVADDCSKDNTLAYIRETLGTKAKLASGNEAEVVYLPTDHNLGHVRNYQRAFSACNGDYIAIIEGDDYWCGSKHIQTHVDFLEAHKECVLSTSHPVIYYEDTNQFVPQTMTPLSNDMYVYRSLEDEIRLNIFENLSACLIRNRALQSLDEGIFSCSILDWPMYVNLAKIGKLCLLSGSSNVYRIMKSGVYAGLTLQEQTKRDLQIIAEIETLFPEHKKYYKEARKLLKPPRLLSFIIMILKKAKTFKKILKNNRIWMYQ